MSLKIESLCQEDESRSDSDMSDNDKHIALNIIERGIIILCIISVTYVFSSALIIHSSFQRQSSNLDAIAVMNELYLIDITSVAFVVCGFVSGLAYTEAHSMLLQALVHIAVDIWVCSLASVVFGTLYALTTKNFSWGDILITCVEGLFLTRCLDFRQSEDAPHNLNVTGWPVSALFFGLVGMPHTISTSQYIDRVFQKKAGVPALCFAMAAISLFSVFASAHSTSNVFYANSTSAMYRCLEFNLGVHIQHLVETEDPFILSIANAAKRLAPIAVLLFLLIWWVEIGVSWMPYPNNCVRMYHFSPCIQAHHGLLVRGCVLGVMTSVCLLDTNQIEYCCTLTVHKGLHVFGLMCLSAISMCWPLFLLTDLGMQITFDRHSVRANAAFMVPVYLSFAMGATYLYQKHIHPGLYNWLHPKILSVVETVRERLALMRQLNVTPCYNSAQTPAAPFTNPQHLDL